MHFVLCVTLSSTYKSSAGPLRRFNTKRLFSYLEMQLCTPSVFGMKMCVGWYHYLSVSCLSLGQNIQAGRKGGSGKQTPNTPDQMSCTLTSQCMGLPCVSVLVPGTLPYRKCICFTVVMVLSMRYRHQPFILAPRFQTPTVADQDGRLFRATGHR